MQGVYPLSKLVDLTGTRLDLGLKSRDLKGPKTGLSVEPEPTISITTLVEEDLWNMPQNIRETCDAIYIVVVFLKDLKQWAEEDRQKMDSYLMSKHGSHLVSDMALLENQLLLDHTINVVQNLDQAVIETIKFMLKESKGPSPSIIYLKLPFNREDFDEVISLFCWYYSPFYAEKKKFHGRLAKELITKSTLLECLHYCLVRPTKDDQAVVTPNLVWSIPTAKELAWSGMRFEADPDVAIQVQFAEPVFKLPALVFDTKIETVVSNLMALERSKPQRPLSRYFQLMNELVDDKEDVRVLKRFGVVRGRWTREGDVVDFVKRVGSFVSYPSMYPSVEDEIGKMRKWHDERSGKFLVRYGWALRWASVAAAASIVATAIFAAKRRG
ncbi:uncharacterized protein LOC131241187 isoform X2 [Magnolia sinica]|uniref:uncharacterized protein LOC131241187 isoform X2 n=1 Tax=Magnolia sinica TaxID=86752 RepID=UPI0026599931|nr:uncharacterized protein LOC131241187 isoform X2 [Magnolia sinica]